MADLPIAWREMVHNLNGDTLFMSAGVRDPEAPCEAYEPTKNPDHLGLRITAPGNGRCDSDGHYLCVGCVHLSAHSIEERTDYRCR